MADPKPDREDNALARFESVQQLAESFTAAKESVEAVSTTWKALEPMLQPITDVLKGVGTGAAMTGAAMGVGIAIPASLGIAVLAIPFYLMTRHKSKIEKQEKEQLTASIQGLADMLTQVITRPDTNKELEEWKERQHAKIKGLYELKLNRADFRSWVDQLTPLVHANAQQLKAIATKLDALPQAPANGEGFLTAIMPELADIKGQLNRIEEQVGSLVGRVRPVVAPNTVPTPSPTFIPRKNITAKIHAALQKKPEQVVVRQAVARAMGGYGKTVAAILYAHEYQNDYPGGRFFLSVETTDLITGLASLVQPLGLTSANDPNADAALVSQTLKEDDPSLLILDNVASKAAWDAMLATGLVPRGNCRVLVTTRDDAIDPAGSIKVGRLEPEEAREVFRLFCEHRGDAEPDEEKRSKLPPALPSDAIADEITAWLGGLAVSISAVAAYMKIKRRLPWEAYWNGDGQQLRGLKNTPVAELPEIRPEVEAQLRADGHDPAPHRRALKVIDDAMSALPVPERRAVEYAALLPHDMAPATWLEVLLASDEELTLTADPDDDLSPEEVVLEHLEGLDILLPGGEGGKLLSLHRLWHARVNERAAAEGIDRAPLIEAIAGHAASRRIVIVGENPDGSDRGVDNPAALIEQALRWELIPLASTCAALWAGGMAGAGAQVGVWLAPVLQHLGRYAEAAACLPITRENEAAVEVAVGHEDLAACYSNLATIQKDQGELAKARASIERAIAIASKHLAPDDVSFGPSYSTLAVIQRDQGDLPGARESIDLAIAITAMYAAPDDILFAPMYSNLAMIQQPQGDLPGARASMERAIAIECKHLGQDHPTLATSYSNLATIQRAQRDLPEARASIERAIAIERKYFPPDHPTFATRYSNLSSIQEDQGDLLGARASIDSAIEIQSQNSGPDHLNFSYLYSNLALIQRAQGDLPGARTSMDRSIAIKSQHLPPDHFTFATSYSNLSWIQEDQGELPGARASRELCIEIQSQHLGPDHLDLATSHSKLAMIQWAQEDLPGARASMERAIAIVSQHLPPDHYTFASHYADLAMIQRDEDDLIGARASMERAIEIDSKHFAPDHPTFATLYSKLALVQRDQDDLSGALSSMERVIEVESQHFAPEHPTFGISYANIATICYAKGDNAAACANFKKSLAILLQHFDENHPHVQFVRESMESAGCSD